MAYAYDPTNPHTLLRKGQLYAWRPDEDDQELDQKAAYQGMTRAQYGEQYGGVQGGQGSWAPAAANQDGLSPWKALGMLASAGTPAGALGFASFMHPDGKLGTGLRYAALGAGAAQSLGALGGFGGFGAQGASDAARTAAGSGTAAGSSLPSIAGGTASTATQEGSKGMGWLNTVGNIFGIGAGGGGKGTGIGGSGITALDLLDIGGQFAKGVEATRKTDRKDQQTYNTAFDLAERQRAALQNQQIQLDLDQREYREKALQQAIQDRLRGSELQTAQDAFITRPGRPGVHMTGGVRPSMIANRVQVGQDLERDATNRMLHPEALPPMPDIPETSTTNVSPTGLDTGLGILGMFGGAVDQYRNLTKRPAVTPTAPGALPPTRRGLPASIIDLLQPAELPYMTNYADLTRDSLSNVRHGAGGPLPPLTGEMSLTPRPRPRPLTGEMSVPPRPRPLSRLF